MPLPSRGGGWRRTGLPCLWPQWSRGEASFMPRPSVEGAGVVQGCRACDLGGEVERRCSCRCPPVEGVA